ncbi:XK-related protein 7 [Tachyglossus aculeatus]|uniref:XK-related protein 7 n=1 Tax=Tachyglossus aculeatus TaxID=9261 RepID=UPI0018F2E3AE|nr:XK-related protein 7 [Tachyglossus aculeatus]
MAAQSDGGCPGAGAGAGPPRPRYGLRDCCWGLCALLVFLSDGATDLWLAADYYLRGRRAWFALTLLFVLLPSLVVQMLSFRWFVYDYSAAAAAAAAAAPGRAQGSKDDGGTGGTGGPRGGRKGAFSTADSARAPRLHGAPGGEGRNAGTKDSAPRDAPGGLGSELAAGARGSRRRCCRLCVWVLQSLIHLLQLGQVWRYVRAMYLGLQSRWQADPLGRHFYWRMMFESADVSMLRLLEAFLKSAPQLVLQLAIMVHQGYPEPLQGLSASASLVSLAWMIASYQKVLRDSRDDKRPMSYKGAVVQVLWHLFTIAARAVAFALFASVSRLYFAIFLVAHWSLMTLWIIQGETDFCTSKWEEAVYNMMVGIVYVFSWFNVKGGSSCCRMGAYYSLALLENAALTGFWYYHHGLNSDFQALLLVCAVACCFALGVFFMLVYYCLLHPNGPMFGARGPPEAPAGPPAPEAVTGPPRPPAGAERDGVPEPGPVFQVRPGLPLPAGPAPRTEGPVIRIDLPRKKYPAWDAHFIDRRLRKTVLGLEYSSPATPRLQYCSLGAAQELLEYETTV